MKVKGLNNKVYIIDSKKYVIKNNDTRKKRSSFHIMARDLLKDVFCGYLILEEVKLPGSTCPSKKSVLFLDFLVPTFNLGIEVHGRQHYEYCQFFHKTKAGFLDQKRRDSVKESWCELNNINLIVFNYADDIQIWRKQLECI